MSNCQNCPLNKVANGDHGCVVSVGGETELRRRLLEMGFTTGVDVYIVRRAPFGDPIECELRGYCLSLRATDAENITLKVRNG